MLAHLCSCWKLPSPARCNATQQWFHWSLMIATKVKVSRWDMAWDSPSSWGWVKSWLIVRTVMVSRYKKYWLLLYVTNALFQHVLSQHRRVGSLICECHFRVLLCIEGLHPGSRRAKKKGTTAATDWCDRLVWFMQTEETHRQRKTSSISAHFLIYGIIHVLKSISWNRAQKIRRLFEREAWQSCVSGSLSEYDFDSWYCSFLTNQEKFCKYLEDACCKAIFNHLLFFVSRCILLNNSYLKK